MVSDGVPGPSGPDPDTFFNDSPTATEFEAASRLPVRGNTGPVGDVGLPPSRPAVASQSATTNSALPQHVRTSRPTSPAMGHAEQTHIPNLTPAVFYSPMAGRQPRENQRPLSPATEASYRRSAESSKTFDRGHRKRNSNASIVTVEQNQRPLIDPDAPPVPKAPFYGSNQTSRAVGLGVGGAFQVQANASPSPPSHKFAQEPKSVKNSPAPDAGSARSPRSPRLEAAWSSVRNGLSMEQNSARGHQRLHSGPSSNENMRRQLASTRPPVPSTRVEPAPLPDKNYEYYNGNAIFFFHGRLLNARTRPLNLMTALLAISPALFYFIFSAPYLWRHVSPAIPIFFAYFFWICISAFFHASFSDPGIFPRNLHKFPPAASGTDPLALGPSTTKWVDVKSYKPSQNAEDEPLAMQEPTKYCESCNIWRRPRTHHCRVCDACIETHDHHCVWLNNCVGRRNYRYFLTFVTMGTILSIYMFGSTVGMISHFAKHNDMSFGEAIGHDWSLSGTFFLFLYSIFVCIFPASLTGYHFWLIVRGETTREYLRSHKFRNQDRHRPYDLYNIWANLEAILCRPRPPTYMQFKTPYSAGDQRFNTVKKTGSKQTGAVEMTDMKKSHQDGPRVFQVPTKALQSFKQTLADMKVSQKV